MLYFMRKSDKLLPLLFTFLELPMAGFQVINVLCGQILLQIFNLAQYLFVFCLCLRNTKCKQAISYRAFKDRQWLKLIKFSKKLDNQRKNLAYFISTISANSIFKKIFHSQVNQDLADRDRLGLHGLSFPERPVYTSRNETLHN